MTKTCHALSLLYLQFSPLPVAVFSQALRPLNYCDGPFSAQLPPATFNSTSAHLPPLLSAFRTPLPAP